MISTSVFLRSAALALALASPTLRAQDTSLHDWLVDGESWKVVADGYGFTDGLCCDAQGNLYFTDVKQGKGIYQIKAAGGAAELLVDDLPGISGLQIGPDGRFYACQNKLSRVIAITRAGQVEVLAEGVKCNDLVVSRKGHVYFTETPTASIHWIAPGAKDRVADKGHVNKPNGITLSADEQTLVVSDHGGLNVWTWSIGEDGALSAAEPFMTMAAMLDKEVAAGDGATTDDKSRYWVTTDLGIQVFDSAGRLAGILAKPDPAGKVVSCEFSGAEHNILFVASGARVYARKLKAQGYFR
jgi:gluconolactonase